ncbi:PHP domain-containing protein [Candidatus Aenigmatarchaeota archaeon]
MLLEMHAHTTYSRRMKVKYDGVSTPEEIIKAAKAANLDAITITDHNTMYGYQKAKKYGKKYGVKVFPGEEISSIDGHVIGFGINQQIRAGMTAEETIDKIHNQGGIAIAVHPFDLHNKGIKEKALKCDATEMFNAINIERLSNIKARRFIMKNKLPYTAGSDAHSAEMVGRAVNDLDTTSIDSVIRSIKKRKNKLHTRYHPAMTIRNWAIRRVVLSDDHIKRYIENNYSGAKKHVSNKMLSITRFGNDMDKLFSTLTYFSFYSAILYGLFKETKNFLNPR